MDLFEKAFEGIRRDATGRGERRNRIGSREVKGDDRIASCSNS
jgi:hypothetical protein